MTNYCKNIMEELKEIDNKNINLLKEASEIEEHEKLATSLGKCHTIDYEESHAVPSNEVNDD